MQGVASSPHLTQSLNPIRAIEPNLTHDSCQKNRPSPAHIWIRPMSIIWVYVAV